MKKVVLELGLYLRKWSKSWLWEFRRSFQVLQLKVHILLRSFC